MRKITLLLFLLVAYLSNAAIINVSTPEQLRAAMLNASPGDEIVIAPGEYLPPDIFPMPTLAAWWSDRDGTMNNPIILRAQNPNNKPRLKGGQLTLITVLRIEGDNWILKDLDVSNGMRGVAIDNADNVQAINLDVHATAHETIHVRDDSDNCIINGCNFYDNGYIFDESGNQIEGLTRQFAEGVYVGTDSGRHYQYSKFCYNTKNNQLYDRPDIRAEHFDIKEGAFNTIVENNTVNGAGMIDTEWEDGFLGYKRGACHRSM